MRTYNDIYLSTRNLLRQSGIDGFSLEAKLLVAAAAGKTVPQLLRDMNLYASNRIEDTVTEFVARRMRGEPVAYITGTWEFYGLPMITNPDVLIPRMDTEKLVDTVKELFTGRKMDARILDLCCGSGCITCAIGHEMPATRLVAIDISANALDVCRRNIAATKLISRVICMQADALSSPPLGIGDFDMIVSNPPYIPSEEIKTLDSSVKDFEPVWALDGGADGLDFYRVICEKWRDALCENGMLFFEVGIGQADQVLRIMRSHGFGDIQVVKDLNNIPRVVFGTRCDHI